MSLGPVVLRTVSDFRAAADKVRASGGKFGLVPTMGALHRGHRALIREARARATSVAVTIFVNPTQFGPKEDLARYPRDLEGDVAQCRAGGADVVFAPEASEMYGPRERTRVRVSGLTESLCGASRPGHFEGVATIVAKLFSAAGPCTAVFGRKDYQQLQVIRKMTDDLLLPVEIVGHKTIREPDGLALSSRNRYLSPDERRAALAIPQALGAALRRFGDGERRVFLLRGPVERALTDAGLSVDYVSVADADELSLFSDDAALGERALLAVAAFSGTTRLIDNVVFGEDPPLEVAP